MGDLETARLLLHPMTAGEAARVVTGGTPWAPGCPAAGQDERLRSFDLAWTGGTASTR